MGLFPLPMAVRLTKKYHELQPVSSANREAF